MHPTAEIYCSLLVFGRQEQSAHLPSDSRRRRAEDFAVHHHSLPLHGSVILPFIGQNHGGQICKEHAAEFYHQSEVVRKAEDALMWIFHHGETEVWLLTTVLSGLLGSKNNTEQFKIGQNRKE